MKRTFKIFGYLIVILLVVVLGGGLLVMAKPQLVVNSKNLGIAKNVLKKSGIKIDWAQGKVNVHSKSLFEKHLVLSFDDLVLEIPSVSLSGKFKKFELSILFTFRNFKLKILDLGPTVILSDSLKIDLKPSPAKPNSAHSNFPFSLVNGSTNVHDIHINFHQAEFKDGANAYRGELNVDDEGSMGHQNPWHLEVMTKVDGEAPVFGFQGELHFSGTRLLFAPPLTMRGQVDFASKGMKADAAIDYSFLNETAGKYNIKLNFNEGKAPGFKGNLSGKINSQGTNGLLKGVLTAQGIRLEVGELRRECTFNVTFMNHFKLECPAHLLPLVISQNIIPGVDFQKDINLLHFLIKAELLSRGRENDTWDGSASVGITTDQKGHSSFYDFEGDVDASFKNVPLSGEIIKNLKSTSNLSLKIAPFESVVTALRKTSYAVPAPLNKLGGAVECDVKGDLDTENLALPFKCVTKLKSSTQSLFLTLDGVGEAIKAETGYQPKLKLTVTFDDVRLALPHFGVTGPPPMIPDGRFQKTLATKVSKSLPLKYDITLKVPEDHPVKLLSNLSQAPIPILFQGHMLTGKPIVGDLEIREFPANLFRRQAIVKYFKFQMTGQPDEVMSGLVEVKYTDYTIKITLSGTVQEPLIHFDSVPPLLSQDQIVSALLFGRATDDSAPDQSSSVESAQAAIADHALALSSMYILASTPVESVGYNSQSRTITAKLHLAKGTSLDIGSNGQGVSEVGVNRHLGGPWYIYTYMYTPTDSTDQSTAAFLEWVLRY